MKTLEEYDGSSAWESQPQGTRDTFQSDKCIALYLRDVGQVQRLTQKQEAELAARIQEGDRQARDEMIKANLPLVIKIAKNYQGIGVPLLDLISEGNIGLVRAVEKFDPRKGAKLSGYGALWIKQAITQALASQSKPIRLPTYLAEKLGKMRRTASRLEQQLGREPTDEELALEVGTTSRRVTQMRMAAIRPASLDAQIDGEEIGSYADIIADEKAESPCEKLDGKARTGMLRQMINTLDRREQAVLRSRFELEEEPTKTLEELGQELSLSGERVRQIQKTALGKLRRRIKNLENRSLLPARRRSANQFKVRL